MGIGTNNPQRRLVVQNNTAIDPSTVLALYNVDTTDNRNLVLSFRTDTTGPGATLFHEVAAIASSAIRHDHATIQSDLQFWITGAGTLAQAMRIDPSGNVGIGTPIPTNPYGNAPSRLAVKGTEYVVAASTDKIADGTAARIAVHSPAAQGLVELDWFNDAARTGSGYGVLQVGKTNWNQALGIGAARVGIGTASPIDRLDVRGNVRATGAIYTSQHDTHLPWWCVGENFTGYVKLVTPIVRNESNMFSIKIIGYKYGSSGSLVEIRCGGYAYAGTDQLLNTGCYTEGTDMPVEIGVENRNGSNRVVIRLGTPTTNTWYYDNYTAEYVGWTIKRPEDFQWVKGETTPAQTGNTNNIFLDDVTGNGRFSSLTLGGVTRTTWPAVHDGSGTAGNVAKWTGTTALGNSSLYDNGNIGIGTTSPQVPLHVMGTSIAPSSGASPNGSLALGSTGTGVQLVQGVTADVSPQYGWLQTRYTSNADTYNLVLNPIGGNLGIRTTNPGTTVQIGQGAAGNNVDYTLSVQRHGTLDSPGTWSNTPAIMISDTSGDGPGTVDASGLLAIYTGRVATNDPNAANATLFYARNDDAGGVRIDGKKNLWVGWDQSSTTTQNNSLIVQDGKAGFGTQIVGSRPADSSGSASDFAEMPSVRRTRREHRA